MWKVLIDDARERGAQPRVHGNGFIQLDLNQWQRAHFWGHPAIPCQRMPSPIHNHRFNFASAIMKGALTNVVYRPVWRDEGLFSEWRPEAREGEDTVLHLTGRRCDLHVFDTHTYHRSYFANGVDLHETIVHEPTVTIMTKVESGPPPASTPTVLVRGFHEPDNEFDRNQFDSHTLWGLIELICS